MYCLADLNLFNNLNKEMLKIITIFFFHSRSVSTDGFINPDESLVIFGSDETDDSGTSTSVNKSSIFMWKRIFTTLLFILLALTITAMFNYNYCIYTNSIHRTCTLLGRVPEFQKEYVRHTFAANLKH